MLHRGTVAKSKYSLGGKLKQASPRVIQAACFADFKAMRFILNPEDKAQAFQTGCDDFITKPLQKNELIQIIQNNLLANK